MESMEREKAKDEGRIRAHRGEAEISSQRDDLNNLRILSWMMMKTRYQQREKIKHGKFTWNLKNLIWEFRKEIANS
jgi:hypothetical protein